MNAAVTIEQFHALLKSEEQKKGTLLEVLRQLTTLDEPKKVRILKATEPAGVGWQ